MTRRTKRSWGRRLRFTGLALVVLAALLYVTRTHTLFPLGSYLAERLVERRFDAEVELVGLRGDGWRSLEADSVELTARPSSKTRLRHLVAEDLRVRLSLLDLVRGKPGWLSSVSATTLDAGVDLTRPGSGSRREGDRARDLGAVPDVRVRSFSGHIELGHDRRIEVRHGTVRSTPTPEGPELSLEGIAAELLLVPGAPPYAGEITAELVVGEEYLFVHEARFDGADGMFLARDVRAPYSSLRVDGLLKDTKGKIELEMDGLLARLGAPQDPPSHLKARGALSDGGLVIQEAELTAAGGALRIERGFLRIPDGVPLWSLELTCDVPRVETLEGLLGLEGWAGALRGRATVDGKQNLAAFEINATAERLELANLRFGTGTLAGALAVDLKHPYELTGSASVRAAPAWVAGRELEELRGDITLSPDLLRIQGLAASQPGNRLSVPDLVLPRSADPARLLAGAVGEVELELTALERLWLPDPSAGPAPEHRLVLSASIADGTALLKDAALTVAGGSFNASSGSLRLAEVRSEVLVDLPASFDFPDLAPLGVLLGQADLAGSLAGEVHASGPLDQPRVTLTASGTHLSARGFVLEELDVSGEVDGSSVRLGALRASGRLATLELAGQFEREGLGGAGKVELLRLSRDDRELVLREPTAFSFGNGQALIEPLVIEGSAGSLELSLRRAGDVLSVFAEARMLDIDQLLPGKGLGRADGRLTVERTGDDLALGLHATLGAWHVPGFEGTVGAQFDLEQKNERLVVERLEVESSGGEKLSFVGEAPIEWWAEERLAPGPLSFRSTSTAIPLARFELPPPFDAIAADGKGDFTLELTGTWAAPLGRVEVALRDLAWTAEPGGELTAELTLAEGGVSGAITAGQAGRFTAESDAHLATDVDARKLVRGDLEDLLGAPLAAELTVRASELTWLAERVPVVRRAAGSMLANLHAQGTLSDPVWDGRLVVGGGEIKLNSGLPALSEVRGSIHLTDEGLRLAGVTAELGGAPIQVGGTVSLPDGGPVELDLTFRGERLLLARDPEVLLRADADLALKGTWDAPSLSGKLNLRRSWLSKRITLLDLQPGTGERRARGIPLFSFRDPPFRDMKLDLQVGSTEPILLRGNVARGALRPEVRITGTGQVPRLEGTVYLEPSTVTLPGATVEFRGGTLTFDPRNPSVPILSLVGTAEKFGHDITAVVTGPYDDPEIELTSTPPLSSEDILLILLAGRPPTGFAEGGAIEATQTIAIYLAKDLASTWGGGGEDDDSSWTDLIERVEVVSGREISRNGVPTLEVRLQISEDFPADGVRTYLGYDKDVYEDESLGVRFAFRLK